MPLDATPLDLPPPIAPRTHGGARPGAGAPRGPRPETVARLARLREIAGIDEHADGIASLSNLDIVQMAIWRLWIDGQWKAAADLAMRLLPYHHSRKPTISVVRNERASAADDDAPPPADAPPELVPDHLHPPQPRPPETRPPETGPRETRSPDIRQPRSYEMRIERKLAIYLRQERRRRELAPDEPTEVPPYWREEIESRLVHVR